MSEGREMLLVLEAGALAGVWVWEWRRELPQEQCLGYASAGQACCEMLRFISVRYPSAMALLLPCPALHACPGKEAVN